MGMVAVEAGPGVRTRTRQVRGGVALLGTTGALASALLGLAGVVARLWDRVGAPVPVSLAEAVTLAAAALGLALGGWLALATAVAVVGHVPGTLGRAAAALSSRFAPSMARRAAALLVGAALGTALAPAATAAADRGTASGVSAGAAAAATAGGIAPAWGRTLATPASTEVAVPSDAPVPGWVPRRPAPPTQSGPALLTSTPAAGETLAVVVRRGDTLWDIARRHLGPDATAAQVCLEWPRWHAANRSVIGDDPHLIRPGDILVPPDGTQP
jgi:nucleoid-associated protein YgaU